MEEIVEKIRSKEEDTGAKIRDINIIKEYILGDIDLLVEEVLEELE